MKKIMLSADSNIMLYEVKDEIMVQFDDLISEFYKWKKTNNYDERLFVRFLKTKFGNDAIIFLKDLGSFSRYNIPGEYQDIYWYNF